MKSGAAPVGVRLRASSPTPSSAGTRRRSRRHRVGLPDASGLHRRCRGEVSALWDGAGPRRSVRRPRLPARFPHRAIGREAGPEDDAALPDFPPWQRRADQEVRDGAREAVPPLRHQPGHGVFPAPPPGGAGRRHVVDRGDAAESRLLQGALGLSSGRRLIPVHRPAARDRRVRRQSRRRQRSSRAGRRPHQVGGGPDRDGFPRSLRRLSPVSTAISIFT